VWGCGGGGMVNTKSAVSEKFRDQKSGSISVRERTGIQQPEDSFSFSANMRNFF
jgi:hypothetical protein